LPPGNSRPAVLGSLKGHPLNVLRAESIVLPRYAQ
jgi:hypothetical protein